MKSNHFWFWHERFLVSEVVSAANGAHPGASCWLLCGLHASAWLKHDTCSVTSSSSDGFSDCEESLVGWGAPQPTHQPTLTSLSFVSQSSEWRSKLHIVAVIHSLSLKEQSKWQQLYHKISDVGWKDKLNDIRWVLLPGLTNVKCVQNVRWYFRILLLS